MHVLIVEDNLIVSMMMEFEISDLGHDVIGPAATATAALDLIEGAQVDLALIDYDLGSGGTGAEVVQVLAGREGCTIVYVTGNRDKALARPEGAAGVLEKPLSPSDLQRLVGAMTALRAGEEPDWPPAFERLG